MQQTLQYTSRKQNPKFPEWYTYECADGKRFSCSNKEINDALANMAGQSVVVTTKDTASQSGNWQITALVGGVATAANPPGNGGSPPAPPTNSMPTTKEGDREESIERQVALKAAVEWASAAGVKIDFTGVQTVVKLADIFFCFTSGMVVGKIGEKIKAYFGVPEREA